MVSTLHGTKPSETETAEVEAVKQDERETVEIPRMGTQAVTLPIRAFGAAKIVNTKIVSMPARRITIEGMRVISADISALDRAIIRPAAVEVDEQA